jgi:hypothetical protein
MMAVSNRIRQEQASVYYQASCRAWRIGNERNSPAMRQEATVAWLGACCFLAAAGGELNFLLPHPSEDYPRK